MDAFRLALDAIYEDEQAEGRVGLDVGLSKRFCFRGATLEQNGRVGAEFWYFGGGVAD